MKPVVAQVKNVKAFFVAGQALLDCSVHTPRFGVAFGPVGGGKSRTVSAWATRTNAIYIRALAAWRTPGPMLEAICAELGVSRRNSHTSTIKLIAEVLARSEEPRSLLVDEADYLVKHDALLDTLRDIHDLAVTPIWLVGMDMFLQRLVSMREQQQFVSRISQVVKFKLLDREDTGVLLDAIGEVKLAPDLVDRLHKETEGSARLLVKAMELLELHARNRGLSAVSRADAEKLSFNLDRRPMLLDLLELRSADRSVA